MNDETSTLCSPQEAGEWAIAAIESYVEACNAATPDEKGRALVMLMSTAAAGVVEYLGPERTHATLVACATAIYDQYRAGLIRPDGTPLQ
jgi:hypothetical protein